MLQLMLHEPETWQWQFDDLRSLGELVSTTSPPRMLSCEKLVLVRNLAITCKMIFQAYQESLGELVKVTREDTEVEEITQVCIGAERYEYIYDRFDENTWICQRGSDWAAPGQRLVLRKSESEGHWTDFDCVNGVDETETTGIPVFRTFENPIVEGEHHWQVNWNRSRASPEWRDMDGVFMTRTLGSNR